MFAYSVSNAQGHPTDDVSMVEGSEEPSLQVVQGEESVPNIFELPFPVATTTQLEQRAYFTSEGACEWLWSRAHARIGVGKDIWKFLKGNTPGIKQVFHDLQIEESEFKYNPENQLQEGRLWKDHTFNSRGFLGMLVWLTKNRPLKVEMKEKGLRLILDLVTHSHQNVCSEGDQLMGMVVDQNGVLKAVQLTVTSMSVVNQWGSLLAHSPGGEALWEKLKKNMLEQILHINCKRASFSGRCAIFLDLDLCPQDTENGFTAVVALPWPSCVAIDCAALWWVVGGWTSMQAS